jgi:hypothetical protein
LPLLLLQDQFIAEYAELTVQGAGPVHITGYYSPNYGGGDSEEEEEEGEDGYGVSSSSSSSSKCISQGCTLQFTQQTGAGRAAEPQHHHLLQQAGWQEAITQMACYCQLEEVACH